MDDSTPTTTTPTPAAVPPPTPPPASSTFGGPTTPEVSSSPTASSLPPPSSWAPTTNERDRGGHYAGIVAGLVLLGLGLWFFADRTLGLDLPDIRWSQFWPLILILIGAAILLGALRRDRR